MAELVRDGALQIICVASGPIWLESNPRRPRPDAGTRIVRVRTERGTAYGVTWLCALVVRQLDTKIVRWRTVCVTGLNLNSASERDRPGSGSSLRRNAGIFECDGWDHDGNGARIGCAKVNNRITRLTTRKPLRSACHHVSRNGLIRLKGGGSQHARRGVPAGV